jgi:hypothetical protein
MYIEALVDRLAGVYLIIEVIAKANVKVQVTVLVTIKTHHTRGTVEHIDLIIAIADDSLLKMQRDGAVVVDIVADVDIVAGIGIVDVHHEGVNIAILIGVHADHVSAAHVLTGWFGIGVLKEVTALLVYGGRVTGVTPGHSAANKLPVELTGVDHAIDIEVLIPQGIGGAQSAQSQDYS